MRGTGIRDGAPKALLARALYDNHPDCSDELGFSRGDILTILEQNVPESEGWWKCRLHGRQGLAPANRLQILTEAPADGSCAPQEKSSGETCQVPTLLHPARPGPVYEPMRSWVEGPLPPAAQAYEFPVPAPSARIICEKTVSFPKQAIFVLPRPSSASLPALPSQVYDVPVQSRVPSALKEPEKQQLYDILPSPQKATPCLPASQAGNPRSLTHQPLSQQHPGRKVHLSEHCRLYFGALFKAISVFHSSLSNSQPPEIFITQSKLVIMVGQKLVDTLCKETQEKDVRNEILCSSSHLCGLLKDLALATKNAVLNPSPAALRHLQAEAKKLEHHTRQFRGTLD
uniref:Cas scaffold protein family member 4 n=1 Tax=Sciurus vulgaris TaxID=55149 RepID=A0A8D2AQL1_SCIVU